MNTKILMTKILTDGAECIADGRRVVNNEYGKIMKEN